MLPGGGRPMGIAGIAIIVVIALCAFVAFSLLGGGGDDTGSDQQAFNQPVATQQPVATRVPAPTLAPALALQNQPANATGGGDTWTVMLYQDADDKILEKDIYIDLNEAERIGSTDNVNIVAQVDRFRGGYDGDGNWTSTKRYLVGYDDALGQVRSQEIADIGEANKSAGETLGELSLI